MMGCIKAGVLGGIVLFVWAFVSWMVLPWHAMTMHPFKSEVAVSQSILANAPQSGVYVLPSIADEKAQNKSAPQGPMIFAAVNLQGKGSSMTPYLLVEFATQVISAFLVAVMLSRTKGLGFIRKVLFVMTFALTANIVMQTPYWNWFGFDTQYTLTMMAESLIGWFLAGLVIAKVTKS